MEAAFSYELDTDEMWVISIRGCRIVSSELVELKCGADPNFSYENSDR